MSSSEFLNLIVTNSNNDSYSVERRFKKDVSIAEFKNKLELIVGCQSNLMKLEIYNKNDDIVCQPNENDRTLGSYPVEDGMRVHVVGDSEQTNEEGVRKFELSQEEYSKRSDTLKAFLKEHKLGKYDEEEAKKKEEQKQQELKNEERLLSAMKVGDRCEVIVPGNPKRRATVMYIGKTDFKSGWWVGVKYDEPFGKNDGSVAGKKYFECFDKYGGFVKPTCVVVGDFPEESIDLDEEL
ncbi:tubulin-folding cofactor B [Copidosoma floridanum]|uniref:tubulin-folding cofactor B n=1 Tax=Copidosoma floridanum TaxID=29053 RepID=UPI0006C981B6|nr:tubulin-folding cofactor B [Copidosoma floridanum]